MQWCQVAGCTKLASSPLNDARCNHVEWRLSCAFTSLPWCWIILPTARSQLFSCMMQDATALSFSSRTVTSAPCSINRYTESVPPLADVQCNGVESLLSRTVTFSGSRSNTSTPLAREFCLGLGQLQSGCSTPVTLTSITWIFVKNLVIRASSFVSLSKGSLVCPSYLCALPASSELFWIAMS